MKASQFEIEEMRREQTEIAPIVTADTVDEAMVSGTLPPVARPIEPVEIAAPKEPPRESTDGATRHRRRRRRRKSGGPTVAATPEAGHRTEGGVAAGASHSGSLTSGEPQSRPAPADREEPPVFSEGPEEETRADSPLSADASTGPALPRLAELPASDRVLQGAHHRRRRRRRRRGRGGHAVAGSQPQHGARSPSGDSRSGAAPYGNGPADFASARPAPSHEAPSAPAPISVSQPEPESTPVREGRDNPPSTSSEASEPKPRRRWWRRSFSRG